MEDINWRDIRHTCCDLSGKKAKDKCPHHWYVILSRQKYNQQSNEILGVPLTSKQNYYSLNFGINITDDDIVIDKEGYGGKFVCDKNPTFALCDRPSRLDKIDLKPSTQTISRISEAKIKEISDRITRFINHGD